MRVESTLTGEISGYASLYGRTDSEADEVAAGAFDASLSEWTKSGRAVPMLWQHDLSRPIGLWTSFKTDGQGLFARGRLLIEDVVQAREAHALARAGAVTGLSIGYRAVEARRERGVRLLTRIKLYEVSLVTFPALEGARVSAVKDDGRILKRREKHGV